MQGTIYPRYLPHKSFENTCNGLGKCCSRDAVRKQDEGEMRAYVVEEEVQ
jgi:uncharacterized cysteine cluster protein YcgN (CxxCxxCC family)